MAVHKHKPTPLQAEHALHSLRQGMTFQTGAHVPQKYALAAHVRGHERNRSLLIASVYEEDRLGYRHRLLHLSLEIQEKPAFYGRNARTQAHPVSSSASVNHLDQ